MRNGQYVVLAIYEVHLASALLMVDGEVVAAAHEERFSRLKNDIGFPLEAARFCLQRAGMAPEAVDAVALVTTRFPRNMVADVLLKRMALYSIADWVEENRVYWYPKLVEGRDPGDYFHLMGGWDRVAAGHHYDLAGLDMSAQPEAVSAAFNEIRMATVERLLGIPRDRVRFMPHYMCHHYHAYYSGPLRGEDVVIVHAEGSGEDYNQAVSRPTPEGLSIVAGTNRFDLGRLYQWMTLLLGMKPYSHEFKLMGMAPHANEHEIRRSLPVFERVFRTDPDRLVIEYADKPSDLYFHFRDALEGHRFDGIAGALQRVLEDRLAEWLSAVVARTGRARVAYGGGVAMNVKANMRLAGMPTIEELFVPLSPADESNVFGAAYWLTERHFLATGRDPRAIPPLATPYLGREHGPAAVREAATTAKARGFRVEEGVDAGRVAALLAEGRVVARCQGPAEFGQRALGNRSILADPSASGTVDKINRQIKYRDFWMPFAPSVLDSHAAAYLENPKGLEARYMTMAFATRPEGRRAIPEALHQTDHTARPQIVGRRDNPGYHALIGAFERLTGVGAVLNTSFNLHGEPIVDGPADALHVFENSELDAVWFGDLLIARGEA